MNHKGISIWGGVSAITNPKIELNFRKYIWKTEQAEWCWTSGAVAFASEFSPLIVHSGNSGATAMVSTIRLRGGASCES
ncbi:hypothetical protein ACFQY3_21555 [Paenibacillus farraposensis]|uniref:hypothetical protein n=1 Tax=Paenibacillus farraposensis TaxID=2807095 RepID=UPI001E51B9BE|nr:hypothetical protein [Paenibacillus farraposensis]